MSAAPDDPFFSIDPEEGSRTPDEASKPPVWTRFYPEGVEPSTTYPFMPLWGFVAEHAAETPEETALIHPRGTLSYGELWDAIEDAALGFAKRAAESEASRKQPAPRVLLHLPNGAAFVVSYFAALRAGWMVSAASTALSPLELAAQCKDVDPLLVISDQRGADKLAEAAALPLHDLITLDPHASTPWPDGAGDTASIKLPDIDAPWSERIAVLQYTSGTTGEAKGAMMTHRNLSANALQNAWWFGWNERDVNLGVLPLFHTWGMCTCLNSTLAVGATLVLPELPEAFDPQAVIDACEEHQPTILYGSATMFHRLLERLPRQAEKLASLRHVKPGAMLSQGDLKERWDALFPQAPMHQGYGLTEASPESHNNPPKRFKAGTVGVPIQNTLCKIVDPANPEREMPVGEAGEVLLKGPQITRGYWRKPEASLHAFFEGWLRTGDLGAMDEEGYLTILDRIKDLLKFRGYSVTPGTVESCLLSHPWVSEVVVVGQFSERDGDVPLACVVCAEGAPLDDDELFRALHDHAAHRLARYEIPRFWRRLTDIPKNRVGKPLRRVLRDWVNGRGELA